MVSRTRIWVVLGLVLVLSLTLTQAAAQGTINLDGVASTGEWDPAWQVATDPLDVSVTGTGAHPHDAPTYARSGYDATGLWARYQAGDTRWYFRLDVDGRAADSDSQTGTAGSLGVGTHDVDGGPLGIDSTGIGLPEAYRLRFQYQSGGSMRITTLGGDSAILPGVLSPTIGDVIGSAVYSTTFDPGIIEWAFDRAVLLPDGSIHNQLWVSAQIGDNSDQVSDDDITPVLLVGHDVQAQCAASPIVIGDQETFPVHYIVPAAAALGISNVTITVPVPTGTSFVSASNGGTYANGLITWSLGDLAPGDAGQVTFTLNIDDQMTSLSVSAEITCDEGLRYNSTTECGLLAPTPQPPEPPGEPVEIPEPATIGLLLAGLGSLAGYITIQKRRK